jgi:hypothetical protein
MACEFNVSRRILTKVPDMDVDAAAAKITSGTKPIAKHESKSFHLRL